MTSQGANNRLVGHNKKQNGQQTESAVEHKIKSSSTVRSRPTACRSTLHEINNWNQTHQNQIEGAQTAGSTPKALVKKQAYIDERRESCVCVM
jgi:hypothetical protein